MAAALRSRILHIVVALIALLAIGATTASAETLIMPARDAKKGVSVVVWGITTQSTGTYTMDYGDGSQSTGAMSSIDRSYMAFAHTYAVAGNYNATLTVGAESATVKIQVFDTALLTAENTRSLGINMAIQDGLRWLWVNQTNRTNFDTTATTSWSGSFPAAYTSFVTLAFENHGFKVPNSAAAPTGIYAKYVVRRGLNYVISNLSTLTLSSTTKTRFDPTTYLSTNYTDNPCQGLGADCVGLYNTSDSSYQTAVAILALAGSGAMNRVQNEVGGYTNGKTYKEILQRMANAEAYGQEDNGNARGGWYYNFNQGGGDGSTLGWAILGMLDAEAAGVVVPQFVKEELKYQVGWQKPDKSNVLTPFAVNTDGGLDYCADGNPNSNCSAGLEKGGIPLQAYYMTGQTAKYFLGHDPVNEAELLTGISGTRVQTTINYLNSMWNGSPSQTWGCNTAGDYLRGCSYAMFNAFKGLKLTGVTTMNNSTRAAGPGTIQAKDWYAEFQDYLVSHQQNPNTTGGGFFPAQWSCCDSASGMIQAIAELVLSPVALVLPDEDKFSTVGLTPATNSAIEGNSHTVTAKAESSSGTPVAGATVVFKVLGGPNAGAQGSANTGSNGLASFTYTDPLGNLGTDTIQAFIGTLASNTVTMNWLPRTPTTTAVVCPASVPYSGSPQTPCTATTYVTADPSTVLVANAVVTYSANVNPGAVTASASYAGTVVYGPSSGSGTFDILKVDPVIVVNGYTGVYDGQAHGATGSATGVGGANLNAMLNLGQSFTNVPGGTANWTFAGNAFYNAASGSVAITITPKPATVTVNSFTKVYGDADPVFTGTLAGFLAADSVTATYDRVVGESVTGGPYTITAMLSPVSVLGNYDVTYVNGALTITAKAASVTPNAATKAYGDADPSFSGTLAGFLPADGVTATYSRTAGETVLGGPYTISATLAGVLSNYAITYNVAPFTITPKSASVTPDAATKEYGSADPVLTGTLAGFLATDGVAATYSRTAGETVLGGPYTISATLAPNAVLGNYAITYGTAPFTITAKAASVTPDALSKVYGSADPALTGSLAGFLATDGVSASYSRTAGETVLGGPYTISATLAPNAVLSNYDITYATAAFTIAVKAASVTPNAATKTYGDADPALTGATAGFLAADNVTANYGRTAGNLVGTYTISATLAPVGVLSNYAITYNTAAFTVTKKATTTTVATSAAVATSVTLTATVAPEVGPQPTTGTVTFYDGTTAIGSAPVNATGVATLSVTTLSPGYHTITASYSGDANYLASTSSNSINQLIFAYPGANGGTFVIGDLDAAMNNKVTFWGAQWEKLNHLTGGTSNASFKGYANAVALTPKTWTTDPGNSSNPPVPVLPSYIGIIVTSKVTKSGSTISGGIAKIVVVKTDAGYANDPGHAGTGTIVAILP